MIRVGIAGATGYTGYELVKLLLQHPQAGLAWLTSESNAGACLSDVFACPYDLPLIHLAEAPLDKVDVVFLCLPHKASMDAVRQVREAGVKAIDLSADFRLRDAAVYERWYQTPHIARELLPQAVYGLPELHREQIVGANLVANPGCYPTSVILGLYPLRKAGLLRGRVVVDSKSGVSGAGRGLKLMTHFVEANENLSPYSIGYRHRHIAEMEQELGGRAQGDLKIVFSPHLLPVNRGILSTMYVDWPAGLDENAIHALYAETYAGEPFIQLLPQGKVATLAHVVYSNRCCIGLTFVDQHTLIITASIDNLLKGASGQAVQNFNLMFGLDETLGL
ncbi:MAG TPA: N-acetyl-gamma-glutamyl-phosphate reductase [Anaerolineae bacterium]|nr:N-acetyl-gamma-glutamyl-phosphate reductase [Anaerolineae bacterium]HIQ05241.1 N-acetyl-gamma-glutamyl-phosphate reductase [Anaerolineae bacterium]